MMRWLRDVLGLSNPETVSAPKPLPTDAAGMRILLADVQSKAWLASGWSHGESHAAAFNAIGAAVSLLMKREIDRMEAQDREPPC